MYIRIDTDLYELFAGTHDFMDALLLQQYQQLVAARTGIHVREQEQDLLKKSLISRQQALKLPGINDYFNLLKNNSAQSDAEWKQLSILLTNQESYFFRDQGQFAVLRDHILPELIERNRSHRTLRLWSAGCSTGQEPYSLAILVDQLCPFRADWKISILGTDLSEAALDKARRGIYTSWSFRTLDPELQQRYFRRTQNEYEIDPEIRAAVTFQHGNLLRDDFPSTASGIYDIDLILCRNVFIYFKRDAVATVLKKFNRALRQDGYLLTGHAELHDTPLGALRPRTFPGTVIYRLGRDAEPHKTVSPDASTNHTPSPTNHLHPTNGSQAQSPALKAPEVPPVTPRPITSQPVPQQFASPFSPQPAHHSALPAQQLPQSSNQPASTPTASAFSATVSTTSPASPPDAAAARLLSDGTQIIEAVVAALKTGNNTVALSKLEPLLIAGDYAAHCLAAQANANAGNYDQAAIHCRQATRLDPFAPFPFHILARIAEEQGDREEAKLLLKKVNYLAPALVLPYVELGAIYQHEGDFLRARKMRDTALELLAPVADEGTVQSHPLSVDKSINAGDLRQHLTDWSGI
jgi:chemotaxis protein methyltransferase CheR